MTFKLDSLAVQFVQGTTPVRELVSEALTIEYLDHWIDQHKDGWQGPSGAFARLMCRVIQTI